ncbi:acetyl-CoA carboxylase biotin carboxyl carrier protein [Altererythrobacter sp. B11]|uniref:acetyl-CoA carboxylase biotin carboxyl carrier protein n=1 Tax=Altererythrobacter sp. B11 TaxID=2060312 RepID=UPI000E5A34A6|nr:acetyl-CoA carboxylase biotin carboxyl carrier protein [Altererythrobacter sp. B11]
MKIDTQLVRELADMLAETGLTEIEVEDGDRKIRVSRGGTVVAAAAPAMAAPMLPAGGGEAAAPATPAPDAGAAPANAIKSPMVGTVYLAAEPGTPPFVKVGDAVKAGDTLVIVEAMKVMNPITAPASGTVQQILVENAQPVEYDQPLIVVA